MKNTFKFLILSFSILVSGLSFSQCTYTCAVDAGPNFSSSCPGDTIQIGVWNCTTIRKGCTKSITWMPSNLVVSGQGTCMPYVNPTVTTVFYMYVTYQGNCCCSGASGSCATATCDSVVRIDSTTVTVGSFGCRLGKFEEVNNPNLSISPNPNGGKFFLDFVDGSFSMEKTASKPEVLVFSNDGKLVYNSVLSDKKSLIDISDQPKGIYFIRVRDGEKILLSKKVLFQ